MIGWGLIILGGYLVAAFFSGRPVLTFFTLAFFLAVIFLLLTYPVLGWYLFLGVVGTVVAAVVLWLIWISLPFLIGMALGVTLLFLLIITIPKVFG